MINTLWYIFHIQAHNYCILYHVRGGNIHEIPLPEDIVEDQLSTNMV